ncbi:hypothetical protein THAOC_05734 [Thalassiosira oceanica]|uniref:Uncharacterized protein n=1 Tax=Thalassiosira oceanica TaxID=159749 RepID=K0TGJ2_THAOC|nr:hypothetical protein THAOC_05734 [Thalassiosira oceanica]|eukprot:EJK72706.1 hypothetical protein THAOC_05734 [Thalassiosira oceanica]
MHDWQGLTDPGESKERDGTCQWSYSSKKDDVYKEVGLFPIRHYIEVRRQTVAAYLYCDPADFRSMCTWTRRGRKTPPRMTFHGGDGAVGGVNEQGIGQSAGNYGKIKVA